MYIWTLYSGTCLYCQISILELLSQACKCDVEGWMYDEVIVYDQCSVSHEFLTDDYFLVVLVAKLKQIFNSVKLLKGESLLQLRDYHVTT